MITSEMFLTVTATITTKTIKFAVDPSSLNLSLSNKKPLPYYLVIYDDNDADPEYKLYLVHMFQPLCLQNY
ncbi:hypothetical protein DERP_006852 [Dermatophagoides pteronyssinus]|uniref:Uncharacterized protein n=1 Tax=Dermatophagoides pteronyssinus TaxID=6956 RepID=A0ABQ8IS63_DERPT|nr:hypothetical protein DERP_006852 [Dermatophagoides pteronyssinus]